MHVNANENEKIIFENILAEEILKEIISNVEIKEILQQLAFFLNQYVLHPLKEAAEKSSSFLELEKNYAGRGFGEAIIKLATHQSNERMQLGATSREHFPNHKNIIEDMVHVRNLLARLNSSISDIKSINNVNDIIVSLKTIIDLSIAYIESIKSPEKETEYYQTIKNEIFSSSREISARISRKELGLPEMLSKTSGISQTSHDLVKKSSHLEDKKLTEPGKSIFYGVSTINRLMLIEKKYRELYQMWQIHTSIQAKNEIEKIKEQCKKQYGEEIAHILCTPHHEAINFQALANKVAPQFEKLSIKEKLPMVATTSGSTARPIIILIMLKGFLTNDVIDFDKLQVLANALAGFMIYAGHHSLSEVAETYNKTVDYFFIHERNHLPKIIKDKLTQSTQTNLADATKDIGYYYIYGDYKSFLNIKYKDKIMTLSTEKFKNLTEHALKGVHSKKNY